MQRYELVSLVTSRHGTGSIPDLMSILTVPPLTSFRRSIAKCRPTFSPVLTTIGSGSTLTSSLSKLASVISGSQTLTTMAEAVAIQKTDARKSFILKIVSRIALTFCSQLDDAKGLLNLIYMFIKIIILITSRSNFDKIKGILTLES